MEARRLIVGAALLMVAMSGCGPLASDSSRIVGRWTYSVFGVTHVMQFYSDGRVDAEAPLYTSKGKYRFESGRLEQEFEGLLWGTNKISWKYEFKDNTLRLYEADKAPELEIVMTRVK